MPIKLRGLSVSWAHNGKSLVEFRHGELVVHDPRALLSPAELEKGNVSLTLTNVTLTDGGKYISVIQYGVSQVQCGYTLTVQEQQNRIDIELLSAPVHAAQENQMGLESRSAPEHADPTQLHLDKCHHEEAQVGTNVTLWCNFTTKTAAQLG
ncbi:hypothetical protein XELAEV_18001303mg [Xenopus laevis]|nr:hypothetical protein XELAEV_18001303mg [Xenopus laevis]